jgi:hypothetical protein
MGTRYFALILGILYLVAGLAGFIPGLLTQNDMPDMAVDALSGRLFGLFPVNLLHTLVHLAVGIWGLIAYRDFDAARGFAKVVGPLFLVLAIMGLVPGLDTTFGLIPLFSHDIWLHAVTGLLGIYFGYIYSPERASGTMVS